VGDGGGGGGRAQRVFEAEGRLGERLVRRRAAAHDLADRLLRGDPERAHAHVRGHRDGVRRGGVEGGERRVLRDLRILPRGAVGHDLVTDPRAHDGRVRVAEPVREGARVGLGGAVRREERGVHGEERRERLPRGAELR
jgi:hypothetical protein